MINDRGVLELVVTLILIDILVAVDGLVLVDVAVVVVYIGPEITYMIYTDMSLNVFLGLVLSFHFYICTSTLQIFDYVAPVWRYQSKCRFSLSQLHYS